MSNLFIILTLIGAAIGVAAFVLVILSLLLAPWIIDKADHYFHLLKLGKEPLAKGYPLSTGRMSHYGLIMIFCRTRPIKRWVLNGRDDRVKAIETSPRWIRYIMMWVYGGAMLCTVLAFTLCGGLMLIDKYWR